MIQHQVSEANNFLNYIITYFAIAFSGIPFFDTNRLTRAIFLVILLAIFVFKRFKFDRIIIFLIIVTLIIEVIQISRWGGELFSVFTSISFLIILPYLVLKIIGIRYLQYFVNILFIYTLISLVFWTASNFFPGFHDFTFYLAEVLKPYTPHNITESFILYTFESSQELGLYRNPGPFHEPGAFGVFLVLSIVVNFIRTKNILDRKNVVFFVAAITTFSTATYLSFIVLILATTLFMFKKSQYIAIFLFPILTYLSITLINNTDFLGNKVTEQYEEQTEASLTTPTSGRILGARKALVSISKHPITGRGLIAKTKPDYEAVDAAGYGWITWISKIGLPLGILYLIYFYRSLKIYSFIYGINKKYAIIAFISLLIVLAGQKHISSLIFFMIFLTSIIYRQTRVSRLHTRK